LSKLNKDLNRLLDGDDTHLASSRRSKARPEARQFLVRDYQEAIELYEFIRHEGYDCECDNPHVTNFGLHCPAHSAPAAHPDFKSHKWDFELVLPPSRRRESKLSGLSLLEEPGTTSNDDRSNQRYVQFLQGYQNYINNAIQSGNRGPFDRAMKTWSHHQQDNEAGQYQSLNSKANSPMKRMVARFSEISAHLSGK
jgi:hypothetical protein